MTNFTKTQQAIQLQEKKDLDKCIQFFNYQFKHIKYEIPSCNRSDVNITATTRSNQDIVYNVEIKERNCNIDTFNDSIIEIDKYNYLVSDQTKIPLYYVEYKDCIAVYNLSKIDISKVERRFQKMTKTTFSNSEKIYKEVYGLKPELATTFNKINYKKIQNANYQ